MKTKRILLVEDDEGDIVLTQEALEESQFEIAIDVARNGQEALDHLMQRNTFRNAGLRDSILLDINIPIKNGHEVLSEIKKTDT